MRVNRVRQAIRQQECVVGTMIADSRNPEVTHILAAAGMDFVMVDMEHSSPGVESVQHLIRGARAAGIVPLVRVTQNSYPFIARILDMGAMGIMVPRVETAAEAAYVVRCAKYPPLGERGYGARGVVTDYEKVTMAEVIAWLNENTLIIAQIESPGAIDNLDEITRVPGVDVALIGPNDLSMGLGIPGEFNHPRFLEAVDRIFTICLRNGVCPALHTGDIEAAKQYRDRGSCFLLYSNESRLLLNSASNIVRELLGESRKVTRSIDRPSSVEVM